MFFGVLFLCVEKYFHFLDTPTHRPNKRHRRGQSERDEEVPINNTPINITTTSQQHNPASPFKATPTTQRRTRAKENSLLAVEVKETNLETNLARYLRHISNDWAVRVNEMLTFQPTARQHDPANSTHTTPKTTTL